MPKPRGKPNKKVKPVLHIYCEGEKTEPIYLNGYLSQSHPNNRRLKVKTVIIEKTNKNTPVQLVNEAIRKKNSKDIPGDDSFWVVYDREGIAKYSNPLHQQAFDKAKSNNINLAISNVCFEVWLLLHFIDVTACYASYDDLIRNSPLKDKLREKGIRKYDKADQKVFAVISRSIQDARDRAERMNKATEQAADNRNNAPYLLNPYTDVHKLLEAIDDFS